jgi:hypothetical protein
MKMSEILKKLNDPNLKIEDIEDDEAGASLKDLRASRKAYTQETQKRAELEKAQAAAQARFGEYDNAIKEWQRHAAALEQQAQQSAQAAQQRQQPVGGDWRQDPLFQPVATYYDGELNKAYQVIKTLGQGMANLVQDYQTKVNTFQNWADRIEIRRLSQDHKLTDEQVAKFREHLKTGSYQDYDQAYSSWRGSNVDELMKEAEERGRASAMKDAEDKLKAPAGIEMGGQPPAPAPSERQATPEYEKSWGGLANELKALGI